LRVIKNRIMKELIEDYERRLKTVIKLIAEGGNDLTINRLKTKASCYKNFLIDLYQASTTPEVLSGSFTDSDIGKEFEIVGNSNDHGFDIGEVITLSEKNKIDKGDERRFDSKEDYWFCLPEDVRKL
jgi:hypothetical protein